MILLAVIALWGCTSTRPPSQPMTTVSTPSGPGASGAHAVTRQQLQARLMGFADRYLNYLSEAADELEARSPTPECRLAAHATKYYPCMTVVTVASQAEPQVALLDMLVVVTLERIVWEGQWAEDTFKENAPILTKAQRLAEADIWAIAASAMSVEQVTEMRALIEEWRRRNPDRKYVSSTRFDDVAALQGQTHAALSHGFLAPVEEARQAVDETRLLGERAMFLFAHMPLLLKWDTELLAYGLALKPEVREMLQDSHAFAGAAKTHAEAADLFAKAVAKFPEDLKDHREALMKELEAQEGSLRGLVSEFREGIKEAETLTRQVDGVASQGRELAASLERTMATTDSLAARFKPSGEKADPAHPFNVREYTDAAQQLTRTLEELNRSLSGTDQLLASPAWEQWMARVDRVTERRVEGAGQEAKNLIDRLFWRGAVLVVLTGVVMCGIIVTRRWASRRFGPSRSVGADPQGVRFTASVHDGQRSVQSHVDR